MKKFGLFVALLLTLATSLPAYAANHSTCGVANPHDIIISYPKPSFTTTAPNVSILGACDYDFPIYLDGELLETTEHGYFTKYVPLALGKNTFTFTNNGKTKQISILRTAGSTTQSEPPDAEEIFQQSLYPVNTLRYGVITNNNVSHLAYPGSNGQESGLLIPLPKGTTFKIMGEYGPYYSLPDGTFVYKSVVKAYTGELSQNIISSIATTPQTDKNCTEFRLSMNNNALYTMQVEQDKAILTVYNTLLDCPVVAAENPIVKNISINPQTGDWNTSLVFSFQDKQKINGWYVSFEEKAMVVGFKHPPKLAADSLQGARIVVDAGHGGKTDTGTAGPAGSFGLLEKDHNLAIAMYTGEYLKSRGAEVLYMRTEDVAVALSSRNTAIATQKPDLSISIHGNAMPETVDYSQTKGFTTFYSFDLHTGAQTILNDTITKTLGIDKRKPQFQDLALCRLTNCPALLLETSFFTNPDDYEWLIKDQTQQDIGVAIGKGVEAYLRSIAQ